MDDLDDLSIFDMFRMEAEEQAESLQARLLALREGEANEQVLRELMRGAHSLKGAARVVGLNEAVRLTHAMEERFVAAQQGRTLGAAEVDTMLRAVDILRSLENVQEETAEAWSTAQQGTIDELVEALTGASENATVSAEEPRQEGSPAALEHDRRTQEERRKHEERQAQTQASEAAADGPAQAAERSGVDLSLRITAQRFDRIIAMSSDNLIQAQAMVRLQEQMQVVQMKLERLVRIVENNRRVGKDVRQTQTAINAIMEQGKKSRTQLGAMIRELDNLIHSHELNADRLHREVLHARLRPLGEILPNLRRLVRSTAAEMGKQVVLDVSGERTEVDREILEKLRAPLEHLLRNALDHGLETPEEREAAGKEAEGRIRLRARHENGRLAITLSDDGRGIEAAFVARRAVERGLVREEVAAELSQAEVLEFLFLPGFSTRTAVTEISGRGFGLDVVQAMVHDAGGSVRVETMPGKGSSFHIVLPVTRSLMRVLRVEIENETYAIPLSRIARIAALEVHVDEQGKATVHEDAGPPAPVIHLMDALRSVRTPLSGGNALCLFLLNEKGREAAIAFQVDRIVDETTVAVRQLDPRLGRMAAIDAVTLTEQNVPLLIVAPDDVLQLALSAQQRAASVQRTATTAARGSILVVDDSATVRQMIRRTLLRARYHVATAQDGVEAWNLLQISSFDLLVSDVDMPQMNGIELTENVRGNARLAHLPVILLSYKGREEDRKRGLDAGADAYVTKGEFQEAAFLGIVTDLIGPAELQETPDPAVAQSQEPRP